MKKSILVLFLGIFLILSLVSALDSNLDGTGNDDDPYRWKNGILGVNENCEVRIFQEMQWVERLQASPILVIGSGNVDDPFTLSDTNKGLVCEPMSVARERIYVVFLDLNTKKWTRSSRVGAGQPSSPSSVQVVPKDVCRDTPCLQLNDVWLRISTFLTKVDSSKKRQVWDTSLGWVDPSKLKEIAASVIVPPVTPPTPKPPVGVSKKIIVDTALNEFRSWNQGTLSETDTGAQVLLNKYATSINAASWNSGTPWSAIFISWVMQEAGITDFPSNGYHAGYFKSIRESPGICTTHRMSEFNSIQAGDILCACRGNGCLITYDDATSPKESHCDIITEISDDSLAIVGGNVHSASCGANPNVGCTVNNRPISKSNIISNARYFGFISCGETTGEPSEFTDYDFHQTKKYVDTTHLQKVEDKAAEAGMDACYPLVTILFESQGNPEVIGVDANVRTCNTISRRTFIINTLPSECGSYATSDGSTRLREDCENGVNNACVNSIGDRSYQLPIPTQNDFCSSSYDQRYTYGIGLGQTTPEEGSTSITIKGKTFTHCGLFDVDTNIEATINELQKKKEAAEASCRNNKTCVVRETFKRYRGILDTERVQAFNSCQTKKK